MKDLKQALKEYIMQIVRQNTSPGNPYYFPKWKGLVELCKLYGFNFVELVDELVSEKRLGKAIIKGRLALFLPEYRTYGNKKVLALKQEFESFLKGLK